MLDDEQITGNIDIIFERETHNLRYGKSFCYSGSISLFQPLSLTNLQLSPTDHFTLNWEIYDTLKQLFNKIESSVASRKIFIDYIKGKLLDIEYFSFEKYHKEEFHDVSFLAFYFLMKLGKKDDIIEIIQKIPNSIGISGLSYDISVFMHLEPNYFDNSILSALEELVLKNFVINHAEKVIKSEINLIKYKDLQNYLVGVNEELNIDREKVIEFISKYRFPPEMEEFLLEIENLSEFAEWKTISSGMIGNLRTFHDKLIENIAKQIKSKTGRDYPTDGKTLRENYRIYIKQILRLSQNDTKLIKSFTDILNQEGSHAFLSEKKYFNLTKNISIEISLFLFSKLDDYLKE